MNQFNRSVNQFNGINQPQCYYQMTEARSNRAKELQVESDTNVATVNTIKKIKAWYETLFGMKAKQPKQSASFATHQPVQNAFEIEKMIEEKPKVKYSGPVAAGNESGSSSLSWLDHQKAKKDDTHNAGGKHGE